MRFAVDQGPCLVRLSKVWSYAEIGDSHFWIPYLAKHLQDRQTRLRHPYIFSPSIVCFIGWTHLDTLTQVGAAFFWLL